MTTRQSQPIAPDPAFLAAAIEVGDLIIDQAITGAALTYWKAVIDIKKTVAYDRNDLYNGGSGVGLFFLELHKQTHRKKYLQMARRAICSAAVREKSNRPDATFLPGHIGIAYALVKLYQVTGTLAYRTQALALVKSCRGRSNTIHEYLGGNAGTILGLLHIYDTCKEPWLLEMVDEYTQQLLRGIQHGATGIYWDNSPLHIQPLCGFSHGVAGVGFVLLELGRYLDNPAFYAVAEQAFAYENACFDASQNNWPDFRVGSGEADEIVQWEAAYLRDDLQVFSEAGNMVSWCHGAPGISLSRIPAYQLTGNEAYASDIDHALTTTRHNRAGGLSLCHGLAGGADVLMESYLAFSRATDWQQANDYGQQLLQRWQKMLHTLRHNVTAYEPLNPGLFTGLAGVGYTFLRLSDPRLTPSILAPRIEGRISKKSDAALPALQLSTTAIQDFLFEDTDTDAGLRQYKQKLRLHYPSRVLVYIKRRVERRLSQPLLQLSEDQLVKQVLQLNSDCSIYMPVAEGQDILLFRYTPLELEQTTVSQFCYIVLSVFEKPQSIKDAIDTISRLYGISLPEQRALLQTKALQQIRQALSGQILIAQKLAEAEKVL